MTRSTVKAEFQRYGHETFATKMAVTLTACTEYEATPTQCLTRFYMAAGRT